VREPPNDTVSSAFTQVAPSATTYVSGTDYGVVTYSGEGDVTANVANVDL